MTCHKGHEQRLFIRLRPPTLVIPTKRSAEPEGGAILTFRKPLPSGSRSARPE